MKKVIIGVSIAVLGFAAQAEWLYWTVNNEYTTQNTGATLTWSDGASEAGKFYIGRVVQVELNGESNPTILDAATYIKEGGVQKTWPVEIAANGTYGYYIELLSWDGSASFSQVGRTDTQTYAQLNTAGVIYDSSSLTPVAAATWHGGGAMNAPEPTSAMLMLLGVAGLALRRKQRKLA